MSAEHKFLLCRHCGNLVGVLADAGQPLFCCGEEMQELKANTAEASVEKHLPVVKSEGGKVSVSVGSVAHPMSDAHHIAWVYLLTQKGGQRKCLGIDGPAEAEFLLLADQAVAVFAYCNLHGLWKTVV